MDHKLRFGGLRSVHCHVFSLIIVLWIYYFGVTMLTHFQGLPDLGEIYPLGGSADRLGLVDPETGECLPAAMLPYCGRTLLEGLIRDLQVCWIKFRSREILAEKNYNL